MSNDQELFDLCREVYKRTGWKLPVSERPVEYFVQHDDEWDLEYGIAGMPIDGGIIPLYTSDYLLDKLPNDVILKKTEDGDYRAYAPKTVPINSILSDTPLKALLKLVIALDDAGVKL